VTAMSGTEATEVIWVTLVIRDTALQRNRLVKQQ